MNKALLGAGIVLLALGSLVVGAAGLSPNEVWSALVGRFPGNSRTAADGIVWSLRVPRLAAAATVGAGLAAAGVGQQSFYRSRLADPYLLGVSAAAGLGAVVGVLAGAGNWLVPLIAAAAGAVYAVALRRLTATSPEPSRLLLIGLSLGLALTAWTLIAIFIADTPRLPTFTYFIFGSLGTVTWVSVWPTVAVVGAAWLGLRLRWQALDLLALGEVEARHVGLDVRRESYVILVLVGGLTGATVGLAGVIGFVGLLAPIAIERIVGASARQRLGMATLAGMAIVIGSDIVARSIGGPVEVPIGIITSAIGAVVLVTLLRRGTTP